MGTRQPARFAPKPVYGLPEDVLASEHAESVRRAPSAVLPLLLLFAALAAATVWFVALPAFGSKEHAQPTCEVFVLESGTTRCVPEAQVRAQAAKKLRPGARAKR